MRNKLVEKIDSEIKMGEFWLFKESIGISSMVFGAELDLIQILIVLMI